MSTLFETIGYTFLEPTRSTHDTSSRQEHVSTSPRQLIKQSIQSPCFELNEDCLMCIISFQSRPSLRTWYLTCKSFRKKLHHDTLAKEWTRVIHRNLWSVPLCHWTTIASPEGRFPPIPIQYMIHNLAGFNRIGGIMWRDKKVSHTRVNWKEGTCTVIASWDVPVRICYIYLTENNEDIYFLTDEIELCMHRIDLSQGVLSKIVYVRSESEIIQNFKEIGCTWGPSSFFLLYVDKLDRRIDGEEKRMYVIVEYDLKTSRENRTQVVDINGEIAAFVRIRWLDGVLLLFWRVINTSKIAVSILKWGTNERTLPLCDFRNLDQYSFRYAIQVYGYPLRWISFGKWGKMSVWTPTYLPCPVNAKPTTIQLLNNLPTNVLMLIINFGTYPSFHTWKTICKGWIEKLDKRVLALQWARAVHGLSQVPLEEFKLIEAPFLRTTFSRNITTMQYLLSFNKTQGIAGGAFNQINQYDVDWKRGDYKLRQCCNVDRHIEYMHLTSKSEYIYVITRKEDSNNLCLYPINLRSVYNDIQVEREKSIVLQGSVVGNYEMRDCAWGTSSFFLLFHSDTLHRCHIVEYNLMTCLQEKIHTMDTDEKHIHLHLKWMDGLLLLSWRIKSEFQMGAIMLFDWETSRHTDCIVSQTLSGNLSFTYSIKVWGYPFRRFAFGDDGKTYLWTPTYAYCS